MFKSLILGLILLGLSNAASTQQVPTDDWATNPPIESGQFVTAQNGHFFVGQQRMRLVGVNVQAGVYPSYPMMSQLAKRFAALGMNSVRLWPNEGTFYTDTTVGAMRFPATRRGDGSLLDRYDFFIGELKKRGLYVMNPALHHMDIPTIRAWPDPEVRNIAAAISDARQLRDVHTIAPYLSSAYEQMVTRHIRNFLQHRNPYTGNRYADEEVFAGWELANEAKFVYCLYSGECLTALPTILKQRLVDAWRQYCPQEQCGSTFATLPPFAAGWNTADVAVHRLYREFVVKRFIEVSRRLESAARAEARGIGVAVQPFTFNTHAGRPLLAAQAAHGAGDFAAVSAYQTPTTSDRNARYFPFAPFLTRFPSLFNFNFGAIDGKPLVVYETSFFRPYPYRTEWAAIMLALSVSQDWDAVYLYMYGQPRFTFLANTRDTVEYGKVDLPEPSSMRPGDPLDYTRGFHQGGDENVMASWMITAAGLRESNAARSKSEVFARFGKKQVFGLPPGYCADASGCGPGGRNVIAQLNDLSATGKLRLVIDIERELIGVDSCSECAAAGTTARIYQMTNQITWNSTKVLAQFDTPRFKALFGELRGKIVLADGVEVQVNKAGFGCVGIWTEDQQPFALSKRIRIAVCGTSENNGFKLNPELIQFDSPYGAIAGVTSPGGGGIQMERPAMTIRVPGGTGDIRRVDFSLNAYDVRPATGAVTIKANEPFFSGLLRR